MTGNHLKYSKSAARVMDTYLKDHYSQELAQSLKRKLDRQYADFLKDMKDMGGKKNPQAQSVYDCIALFALYEVLPQKLSLEAFEDLVSGIFVSAYQRVSPINMNWRWVQRLAAGIFQHLAKKGQAHRDQWPGNYCMEAFPYEKGVGARFQFTCCPIADFAKTHGYTHLMPAMCNPDYPTMAAIRAGLIRTKVCATDDCCDYWILGNLSPHMKDHPLYKDKDGFLRNK